MQLIRSLLKLVFTIGISVSCQPTPATLIPEVLNTMTIGGFGAGGGQIAANSRTGLVYITNDVQVSVMKGMERIATLPTNAKYAGRLAVDEAGDWVYVVNQSSDNVTVIRGTEVIGNVGILATFPTDVAVEPHSHLAYIVSEQSKDRLAVEGNVMVLSGTQVVTNLAFGRLLFTDVVVDPIYGYIYVGAAGGIVSVIKGLQEIARFQVKRLGIDSPLIKAMDVDRRTEEVYVLTTDGQLTRFQGGKITGETNFWKQKSDIRNLGVHPQTGDVYLVDTDLKEIIIVRDMKEVGRLPAGRGALKMAIDPLSGNVYVANFNDDTVTVIHGSEVLATLKVGWYPYGLGVNPANGWLYVINANQGSVSVLGYQPTSSIRQSLITPFNSATILNTPATTPALKSYP